MEDHMSLTVREANRLLLSGKPVVGTTREGHRIRVIQVHTRQGRMEGKEINIGTWIPLVALRQA
jgi:hypothetical protein